jgi:hypothetical protein
MAKEKRSRGSAKASNGSSNSVSARREVARISSAPTGAPKRGSTGLEEFNDISDSPNPTGSIGAMAEAIGGGVAEFEDEYIPEGKPGEGLPPVSLLAPQIPMTARRRALARGDVGSRRTAVISRDPNVPVPDLPRGVTFPRKTALGMEEVKAESRYFGGQLTRKSIAELDASRTPDTVKQKRLSYESASSGKAVPEPRALPVPPAPRVKVKGKSAEEVKAAQEKADSEVRVSPGGYVTQDHRIVPASASSSGTEELSPIFPQKDFVGREDIVNEEGKRIGQRRVMRVAPMGPQEAAMVTNPSLQRVARATGTTPEQADMAIGVKLGTQDLITRMGREMPLGLRRRSGGRTSWPDRLSVDSPSEMITHQVGPGGVDIVAAGLEARRQASTAAQTAAASASRAERMSRLPTPRMTAERWAEVASRSASSSGAPRNLEAIDKSIGSILDKSEAESAAAIAARTPSRVTDTMRVGAAIGGGQFAELTGAARERALFDGRPRPGAQILPGPADPRR